MEVRLTTPLNEEKTRELRIGDIVFLDGLIFTGRIRFYEHVVTHKNDVPIDLRNTCNVQFHCSPAVREDQPGKYTVSAVTGTASFRFSKYLEPMFQRYGLRAIIGKAGLTSGLYKTLFREFGAVYLSTMGYGFGALYGRGVEGVENVYWKDEFGLAQAMWVLRLNNFGPLIVDGDTQGNSLQEESRAEIQPTFDSLIGRYSHPSLKRSGEMTDPTRDVVDPE